MNIGINSAKLNRYGTLRFFDGLPHLWRAGFPYSERWHHGNNPDGAPESLRSGTPGSDSIGPRLNSTAHWTIAAECIHLLVSLSECTPSTGLQLQLNQSHYQTAYIELRVFDIENVIWTERMNELRWQDALHDIIWFIYGNSYELCKVWRYR